MVNDVALHNSVGYQVVVSLPGRIPSGIAAAASTGPEADAVWVYLQGCGPVNNISVEVDSVDAEVDAAALGAAAVALDMLAVGVVPVDLPGSGAGGVESSGEDGGELHVD